MDLLGKSWGLSVPKKKLSHFVCVDESLFFQTHVSCNPLKVAILGHEFSPRSAVPTWHSE